MSASDSDPSEPHPTYLKTGSIPIKNLLSDQLMVIACIFAANRYGSLDSQLQTIPKHRP